jgi:hypothetical protein
LLDQSTAKGLVAISVAKVEQDARAIAAAICALELTLSHKIYFEWRSRQASQTGAHHLIGLLHPPEAYAWSADVIVKVRWNGEPAELTLNEYQEN